MWPNEEQEGELERLQFRTSKREMQRLRDKLEELIERGEPESAGVVAAQLAKVTKARKLIHEAQKMVELA